MPSASLSAVLERAGLDGLDDRGLMPLGEARAALADAVAVGWRDEAGGVLGAERAVAALVSLADPAEFVAAVVPLRWDRPLWVEAFDAIGERYGDGARHRCCGVPTRPRPSNSRPDQGDRRRPLPGDGGRGRRAGLALAIGAEANTIWHQRFNEAGVAPVAELEIDRRQLVELVDAFLDVPGLADEALRDAWVAEISQALRRPFQPERRAEARDDLMSTVEAAAACSGGLRTLARTARARWPGPAANHAVSIVDEVVGSVLLSVPDREALIALLADITAVDVATAVDALPNADAMPLRVWHDPRAAIRALEGLPGRSDGVPGVLLFAERLAEISTGDRAGALQRWGELVAGGLGVTAETLTGIRTGVSSRGASPRDRSAEPGLVWGGVPIRNRNFTGRTQLLDLLGHQLRESSRASVLPQTLHGLGGVGKTQLVIEYVYRNIDQYDLVWWIPAEQSLSVLTSLTLLAQRLGIEESNDRTAARSVLDALASGSRNWLLVYDNADDPETVASFIPPAGGNVIITTRNSEFGAISAAVEVDVFARDESIELLRRRTVDENGRQRITTAEADLLADKLGDLPLALEQAAAWFLATGMPVAEYVEFLDSQIMDLLSEGKPASYPVTVATFVGLAVDRLRTTQAATAQLFELFAYLGGEPVPISVLRHGREADVSQPLRGLLSETIPMNRAARDLNRFGLARIDALQRIQVHRLVQGVLRQGLEPSRADETLRNVQLLLAAANPGDPDVFGGYELQREIGPHLEPADMIRAGTLDGRRAVLDHARYLYIAGDYEGSRRLATQAATAWRDSPGELSPEHFGPMGEYTLLAQTHVANAARILGDWTAAELAMETYARLQRSPSLGPHHEFTLVAGLQVAWDLRIAGRYREALDFDEELVARHRDVFGAEDQATLRAQGNLATSRRLVGDYAGALDLDKQIAEYWEELGLADPRALTAWINVARSYYGLGDYRAGLDVLDRWWPRLREIQGPRHSEVLLAARTYAITLRKVGRLAEASGLLSENHELVRARFGPNHEFTLAATASYANVLRELGDLDEAQAQLDSVVPRYEADFGSSHPMTLAARANRAIVLRARGELTEARKIDEWCFPELAAVLGPGHPITRSVGASVATDRSLAGDPYAAAEMSASLLRLDAASDGVRPARNGIAHPDAVIRRLNAALDLRAVDDADADGLFDSALTDLRAIFGAGHPVLVRAQAGARLDIDLEPPPC